MKKLMMLAVLGISAVAFADETNATVKVDEEYWRGIGINARASAELDFENEFVVSDGTNLFETRWEAGNGVAYIDWSRPGLIMKFDSEGRLVKVGNSNDHFPELVKLVKHIRETEKQMREDYAKSLGLASVEDVEKAIKEQRDAALNARKPQISTKPSVSTSTGLIGSSLRERRMARMKRKADQAKADAEAAAKREAERKGLEAKLSPEEKAKREAERERTKQELQQIKEELEKVREAKRKEREAQEKAAAEATAAKREQERKDQEAKEKAKNEAERVRLKVERDLARQKLEQLRVELELLKATREAESK